MGRHRPEGENAATTTRYQRESGRQMVILNPWGLLEEHIGEAESYNPLNILADTSIIHLVDDAHMIAEMLAPSSEVTRTNSLPTRTVDCHRADHTDRHHAEGG